VRGRPKAGDDVAKPKRSPYITDAGFAALDAELKGLWVRRREVTAALAAAAAEGDRSENAEYIYRKKELREIDRRIRYLEKRLPELKVVAASPADPRRVYFGAWVTLEDDLGGELGFRIVGVDELDTAKAWISIDSPMAKALLGKPLDSDVSVQTPSGLHHYVIVDIRYL